MAKEICISSTPHETRLAILEDDQLSEIYYERENEYTLAGSVYKGRVTRVLPGMQSAFVDIGLERDAFLYVTDFLEMEEPEDADEVERATTQGIPIPQQSAAPEPRPLRVEGREGRGGRDGRDSRRGSRGESNAQGSPETPRPVLRESPGDASYTTEVSEAVSGSESSAADSGDLAGETDAEGTRRWRGRRRRGGRGRDGVSQEGGSGGSRAESGEPVERFPEEESGSRQTEPRAAMNMEASAAIGITPVQRVSSRPEARVSEGAPFLLPGESLSRYGASAPPAPSRLIVSELPPDDSPAPPERTVSKPSTMIEEEILWDGKGLLPGESLARHRRSEPVTAVAHAAGSAPADLDEASEELGQESEARHNVDPLPPSEFRLKDIFGGRRKEAEASPATSKQPGKVVGGMSAYAPGQGLIEEEVIDEEEYEFTPHKLHVGEEHEGAELEEETLQKQVRSGREPRGGAPATSGMRFERVAEGEPGSGRGAGRGDGRSEGRSAGRGRGRGRDGRGETRNELRSESRGEPRRESRSESRSELRSESGSGEVRSGEGRSGEGRGGEARPVESRSGDGRRGPSRRSAQTSDIPIISDLLKPGQEILVQIAKEPIAQKGARITSHIALPGRFLVFMPTVSHVGVSRKIESDEERQRLKRILVSERGDAQGGFIVRTAADGASEEELRADLRFLINLWNEIKQRADSSRPPALIYHDLNLIERILRDQVSDNFSNIWVDSEADYERIVRFLNRFSPGLVRRVKLYTKEIPLFEHFGIQDEISKALRSKVWLKSGGSIVINQTEALVAIDINTGKYVGKTARLEDTILKTNLDAIPEIVRQIRLRDLGGIIVIDFIDMDERKNRTRVLGALEEALKQDRAPTKVLQFNDFGLVAITRKRVKQSLERTLSVPCPVCQATGMVKSPTTVANEIYIEMRKMRKHFDQSEVTLRVHPETAKALKANNARWMTELEALAGKNVLIRNDATLHPEQYDIQG